MQKLLFFVSVLFGIINVYGQQPTSITIDIEFGTNPSCEGSLVQLKAVPSELNSAYQYDWWEIPQEGPENGRRNNVKRILADGSTVDVRGTEGPNGENTFIRVNPRVTTLYGVRIGGTTQEIIINVDKAPNPGISASIFLCGKTSDIDLFSELDGAPETGGVWNPGNGTYDITNTKGGVFTYTVDKGGACPVQSATVTVRPCGFNDSDNDGDLNDVDNDDDNDGIPDTVEDGFCTPASLTPTFVLEEDFGFGGPTRSKFVEGTGLTFNPGIPQDINGNDGEYNIATSLHIFNFNNESALYISSEANGHGDANGDTDGRFMAINMLTSSFLSKPIFQVKDLPVTPGIEYDFSMRVANLNGNGGTLPNLRIEVLDQATGNLIADAGSGTIPYNNDEWVLKEAKFIPAAGVTTVTVVVTNQQLTSGNGNDVGIDNIFLSRLQCDFDRDGIPNSEDLDSDNDGIYDIVENNEGAKDADSDGRVDNQADSGSITTIVNSDGDSNPDYLDVDSDNDGIIDHVEAMETASYIGPSGVDGNFNGVDDSYDTNGTPIVLSDADADGTPDYLDDNSDDDCLDDTVEAYDLNQDGVSDILNAAFNDADNDGFDDDYDTVVLGRLTKDTNGTNDGQEPSLFPDVHNPGGDRDWRQEFEFSAAPLTKFETCAGGTPVNLFDQLPAGLATTGTWTVPTGGGIALTGGHLGTLDPATEMKELDYVYTLPLIGSCPERKYTLPVEVMPVPFAGENKTVPKCTSDGGFNLFDELGDKMDGTKPSTGGEWTIAATTVGGAAVTFGTDDKGAFDPSKDAFGVYTYTVSGGAGCGVDTATVTITIGGANAGVAPADPLILCRNDTTTIDLFSELTGGPETTGTWTMPVPGGTTTFNGVITPSDVKFISGTYNYKVTSSDATCPDDEVDVEVVIIDIFAGEDNLTVSKCTSDATFDLFDELGDRGDGTTPNTGGVWTVGTTTTVFGTDDKGSFTPGMAGTFTYTYTVTDSSSASCTEDTATVTVTVGGANAGIAPSTITECRDNTTAIDLFALLTGSPQTGGVWTRPDSTTFDGNLIPSDLAFTSGNYTYTVTDPSNPTCASDNVIVEVVINEIPTISVTTKKCDATGPTATVYNIDFTFTNAVAIVSNIATANVTFDTVTGTGTVTDIPKDQDIVLTATNGTCDFDLDVIKKDCDCPDDLKKPGVPIANITFCDTQDAPELRVTVDDPTDFTARWYAPNGSPIVGAESTLTYTPVKADLKEGENVFTVTAVDIKTDCESDAVNVIVTRVNTPVITVPSKREACGEFVLEPLPVGDYYTEKEGKGTKYDGRGGDVVMVSGTLYIYAESTSGSTVCPAEEEYEIIVNPIPVLTAPMDVVECGKYELPALAANQQYFTAPSGGGDELIPGTANGEITLTQVVFIRETTDKNCSAEVSFLITIQELDGNTGSDGQLDLCVNSGSVTLINGLGGSPTDNGTWVNETDTTTVLGDGSYEIDPSTLGAGSYTFVYSISNTTCTSSNKVEITIEDLPTPTLPATLPVATQCETFTLPSLPANQFYSTISLATDPNVIVDLSAGQVLTSTSDLFLIEENANGCKGEIPFKITIENLPQFDLIGGDGCIDPDGNVDPITISTSLNTADYDLQWLLNGVDLAGETNPEIEATKIGDYTIEFSSKTTAGCSDSRTTTISPIESPENLTFKAGLNTVELFVTKGDDLTYTLIGVDNNYLVTQVGNVFRGVPPGEYLATVSNQCNSLSADVSVFGFPEFFSPNGDTDNELWNVKGSPGDKKILISIYDRYGRLMASFNPESRGWNGTYNDLHMPADDYWYYAKTDDGEEYRGHFALLR
ncbi:T9SS type B sorting domain-containing protein [Aquimarina agarilytica]|uniref:T9SS type B sorting domain-containing protein n=1 Tax=Aquimarina agarilytica TaxID=1087449 RepID=UPI0002896483|nr:T9SS type B sorting domain-containing protein [Aquimarina agarilytica]